MKIFSYLTLMILLSFGFANVGHAQHLVFAPTNTTAFNNSVLAALNAGSAYGATGLALSKFANDNTTVIYIVASATQSAGTDLSAGGTYTITLNSDPTHFFLSPQDYALEQAAGQLPKDAVTVLLHEIAHVATLANHSPTDSTLSIESDVIINYENPVRAASGQPARTQWGSSNILPNQTSWQNYAQWFQNVWE